MDIFHFMGKLCACYDYQIIWFGAIFGTIKIWRPGKGGWVTISPNLRCFWKKRVVPNIWTSEFPFFSQWQKLRKRHINSKSIHISSWACVFKGCNHCIFASFFLSLTESTYETRKNYFYFTSKLFPFSRKSKFRILDIQI